MGQSATKNPPQPVTQRKLTKIEANNMRRTLGDLFTTGINITNELIKQHLEEYLEKEAIESCWDDISEWVYNVRVYQTPPAPPESVTCVPSTPSASSRGVDDLPQPDEVEIYETTTKVYMN